MGEPQYPKNEKKDCDPNIERERQQAQKQRDEAQERAREEKSVRQGS